MAREILIVFSRVPYPGKTKTRLIPALGAAGAADLQRVMAEYIFTQCCELAGYRNMSIAVHYAGGDEEMTRSWIPPVMACAPQCEGSLGERLAHAFAGGFIAGAERVAIIGSDCPFLTPEILADGFELLRNNDLVIGPAHDGGYYLIGLRKPAPLPWAEIDWGTDRVLRQTMTMAQEQGLSVALLPALADIDRPEDLQKLHASGLGRHFFTDSAWKNIP